MSHLLSRWDACQQSLVPLKTETGSPTTERRRFRFVASRNHSAEPASAILPARGMPHLFPILWSLTLIDETGTILSALVRSSVADASERLCEIPQKTCKSRKTPKANFLTSHSRKKPASVRSLSNGRRPTPVLALRPSEFGPARPRTPVFDILVRNSVFDPSENSSDFPQKTYKSRKSPKANFLTSYSRKKTSSARS